MRQDQFERAVVLNQELAQLNYHLAQIENLKIIIRGDHPTHEFNEGFVKIIAHSRDEEKNSIVVELKNSIVDPIALLKAYEAAIKHRIDQITHEFFQL